MSTDYNLIESKRLQLFLVESSSVVSLFIHIKENDAMIDISQGLDAKQLTTLGLEFIKVASYIDGDLHRAVVGQDPYVIDELKRALS